MASSSFLRLGSRDLWRRTTVPNRPLWVSALRQVMEIEDVKDFRRRVLQSNTPVLVDFHAGWCGPCHALDTVLKKVVKEKQGTVELAKVDVEVLPKLATEYGITAVPAVMGIRGGSVVCSFVGLQDEQFVEMFASKLLKTDTIKQ